MGLFKKKEKESPPQDYPPPAYPPPSYEAEASDNFAPPDYAPRQESHTDPLFSAASEDDLDLGEGFCAQHQLYPPVALNEAQLQKLSSGAISLIPAPELSTPHRLSHSKRFKGEVQQRPNGIYIRSKKSKDCVFVSDVALYAPMSFRNSFIYYEVTITSLPHPDDATVALGFCCLPYPPFRLPGWHRGSVAVHSDDGRRYVNDSMSGKDFTRPFSEGEVIGIGIDYIQRSVFLKRTNDERQEWFLDNSQGNDAYRDYRDGSIEGLNGEADVYAAVGIYGSVGVEVKFKDFKLI